MIPAACKPVDHEARRRRARGRRSARRGSRPARARRTATSDRVGTQQRVDAAVDEHDRAVHVRRVGPEQEVDRPPRPRPACRSHRSGPGSASMSGPNVGIVEALLQQRRHERSRRDRVDAHAAAAPLGDPAPHGPGDRDLARRVDRVAGELRRERTRAPASSPSVNAATRSACTVGSIVVEFDEIATAAAGGRARARRGSRRGTRPRRSS